MCSSEAANGAHKSKSSRTVTLLKNGWRFVQTDIAGAQAVDFDEHEWRPIQLPHCWNVESASNGGSNFYEGVGWYRLHFRHTQAKTAKETFVRFGAAHQDATIYLNGQLVGEHKGGFTAFAFDISKFLKQGGNVLAVKLSNSRSPDIAPLSADFTFFGGIYRDVQLIETAPVHIAITDFASSGIYVNAQEVSKESATIHVRTVVSNDSNSSKDLRMFATIIAPNNSEVAKQNIRFTAPAGSSEPHEAILKLSMPHLWDGKSDPVVYRIQVDLASDTNQKLDAAAQTFGIRTFSVSPSQGFSLNGKHLDLRGVNMHQDTEGKGWALSSEDRKENIELLLKMGVNAIRLSHYPHCDETLDLLDRNGIISWAEIPLIDKITDSEAFTTTTKQQLLELIHQQYNHPSICFWGIFNEVHEDPSGLIPKLNDLAHEEDPSRLTTAASNLAPENPIGRHTDLIAFNRYVGWYEGAPSDIGGVLDHCHEKLASRSIGLSEYGAGASIHQHEDPVTQPKTTARVHPEEWQAVVHEKYLDALNERPYIWGHFVWNFCDFAARNRHEGELDGINDKGLVTYDRKTPKDAFYFYKANWSGEPLVYICSRRFNERANSHCNVKVYSNQANVDLRLNGKILPAATKHKGVIWIWEDVELKAGSNRLEACANYDNRINLRDAVLWNLDRDSINSSNSSEKENAQPFHQAK